MPLAGIARVPSQKGGQTLPVTLGALFATPLHFPTAPEPLAGGSGTGVCTPMKWMKWLIRGPADPQGNSKGGEHVSVRIKVTPGPSPWGFSRWGSSVPSFTSTAWL